MDCLSIASGPGHSLVLRSQVGTKITNTRIDTPPHCAPVDKLATIAIPTLGGIKRQRKQAEESQADPHSLLHANDGLLTGGSE